MEKSKFFSILINTTQDISVKDQCSIVLRYVLHDTINEQLIAVKCIHDLSGKGMARLLEDELKLIGLNLSNCIGN